MGRHVFIHMRLLSYEYELHDHDISSFAVLSCCSLHRTLWHYLGYFVDNAGGQTTGILAQGYNRKLMTEEDVKVSTSMPTTMSMRNINTTPKKSTSPPLVTDSFLTVHIAQHYLIQQKLGSHLEYRVCTIPLSRYLWCTLHGGPHQTNEETPVQMGLACKRGITQNCTSFLCATNGQI